MCRILRKIAEGNTSTSLNPTVVADIMQGAL